MTNSNMADMNDISKISDKSMPDNMKTLFRLASEGYEDSHMGLVAIAEHSDDPDFIEAVIKCSKNILAIDASELAGRLCKLQNTKFNVYRDVRATLKRYEEESSDYRSNGKGFYHLRLIVALYYGDEGINADDFIKYNYYSDEEIFEIIDNYLANRVDIDKKNIQNKIDNEKHQIQCAIKEHKDIVANKEENIAKLTKELEGE